MKIKQISSLFQSIDTPESDVEPYEFFPLKGYNFANSQKLTSLSNIK